MMALCFSALLTSKVCVGLWRVCVGLYACSAISCSNYFILESRENHVTNRVLHDCDGFTAGVLECAFLSNGHESNESCEIQVDEEGNDGQRLRTEQDEFDARQEQIPIKAQKMWRFTEPIVFQMHYWH